MPDFRTLENRPLRRPSPNLLETMYTTQRRKEWMREYLAGLGAVPLEFIGSATDRTSALTVARAIRETLGLVGVIDSTPNAPAILESAPCSATPH